MDEFTRLQNEMNQFIELSDHYADSRQCELSREYRDKAYDIELKLKEVYGYIK